MARVRGSIDIDRPIDEVFDVVADQTNEPRYNPAMTASHRLDPDGPVGVGSRFRATVLSRGKPQQVEIEITGFERPSEMASRSVMGRSTVTGRLRFDPVASGTRLSWDWDVKVGGAARVLDPLVAVIGRRQERAIWAGLKHFLEDSASAKPHKDGSA
jgi:carbon monoxide dehydrogenase subunit G